MAVETLAGTVCACLGVGAIVRVCDRKGIARVKSAPLIVYSQSPVHASGAGCKTICCGAAVLAVDKCAACGMGIGGDRFEICPQIKPGCYGKYQSSSGKE